MTESGTLTTDPLVKWLPFLAVDREVVGSNTGFFVLEKKGLV